MNIKTLEKKGFKNIKSYSNKPIYSKKYEGNKLSYNIGIVQNEEDVTVIFEVSNSHGLIESYEINVLEKEAMQIIKGYEALGKKIWQGQ